LKYCPECGHNLDRGTEKYCPECGEHLGQNVMSSAAGYERHSQIDIADTGGDVFGTGMKGNENVVGKELGGYTREGNIINIHVNSLSYEILEKIIKQPTNVDKSSYDKDSIQDNRYNINKTQEAAALNQQTGQVLEELNRIEKKDGKEVQGIKVGELQISKDDLSLKKIILKGNEHYFKDEFKQAIECYDKALEIDPKNADAWNNKGGALGSLGKHEEAIEYYDKALKIDPKNAMAWTNKGWSLSNLGRYEEAIEYLDKALEIDPGYAFAWSNKGADLGALGRYEEAIEYLDKALEIDPGYAYAWYNKACYKVKKGDIDNGLLDLKKAIEIDKEQFVKLAKEDKDFESIRNDDRFEALIRL
jgi:tetratricopeptide (TPR) repeat protein